MKNASISKVKNQFSEYIRNVKNGDSVRIYDRGVPIADIVPIRGGSKSEQHDRLRELESKGVLSMGRTSLKQDFFLELSQMKDLETDTSVTETLLSERRTGR